MLYVCIYPLTRLGNGADSVWFIGILAVTEAGPLANYIPALFEALTLVVIQWSPRL